MPEWFRFAGMCIVLLYVAAAMVLVGMSKLGSLLGAVSKTDYRPGSTDVIINMSRRAKILHVTIFSIALVFAFFWPGGD